MDTQALFLSCRKGNLEKVKYLVETKDVEVNVRDSWDSTPLYYACLCGHKDVVEFLLHNGAKCEANTFDGERCLYGALDQDIRNVLKKHKVISAHAMRRDQYEEFLRKMLEEGYYSDVTFCVHGKKFQAHRCIISARSDYFNDLLLHKWRNRTEISINHELITPTAFAAMLEYVYTGRIGQLCREDVDDVLLLVKHCQQEELHELITRTVDRADFFSRTKPGTRVRTVCVEPPSGCTKLQEDLGILSEQALPLELRNWVTGSELPFFPGELAPFADICFSINGHRLLCHKLFFCGRSDYFRALVEDHFCEGAIDRDTGLPVIKLNGAGLDTFRNVVSYLYQDSSALSASNVYEVLRCADVMLLPGLKRRCAGVMAQFLELSNIIAVLRISRCFDLPRLEDQCAEFIANNLEQIVHDPEFIAQVREDAVSVRGRHETDSIPIVDDVRYHITSNLQTFSAMSDAEECLALLDGLLENLGLDA